MQGSADLLCIMRYVAAEEATGPQIGRRRLRGDLRLLGGALLRARREGLALRFTVAVSLSKNGDA